MPNGLCQSCKKYSPTLIGCSVCGASVCPDCLMPGTSFCKICRGRRFV